MMEERITSRKHPLLQQVKKLLSSKKAREEAGLFVADGTKLLAEAIRYYHRIDRNSKCISCIKRWKNS